MFLFIDYVLSAFWSPFFCILHCENQLHQSRHFSLCFLLTLLLCLFKFVVSIHKSPLYNFDNFPNMLSPFSSCVFSWFNFFSCLTPSTFCFFDVFSLFPLRCFLVNVTIIACTAHNCCGFSSLQWISIAIFNIFLCMLLLSIDCVHFDHLFSCFLSWLLLHLHKFAINL